MKASGIKTDLTSKKIADVTILADKYELVKFLSLQIEQWSTKTKRGALDRVPTA